MVDLKYLILSAISKTGCYSKWSFRILWHNRP